MRKGLGGRIFRETSRTIIRGESRNLKFLDIPLYISYQVELEKSTIKIYLYTQTQLLNKSKQHTALLIINKKNPSI